MKASADSKKFWKSLETERVRLQELLDKKQGTFDGKSERWQEGDKGEELQAEIDSLEELVNEIEIIEAQYEEAFENLND